MTLLRISIAGFGWWGRHIARRITDNPRFELGSIVEPAAGSGPAIDAFGVPHLTDFSDAIADTSIDAVILTTPNPVHVEQVVAAAAAGKHVYCEKPLALTGAGARQAVDACRSADRVLGIGHERRFEPGLEAVKSMIDNGDLGTLMHAESAFSHDKLINVPKDNWRTRKSVSPAAGMTGMGIHLTDLYIWMFGKVRTVQALTADRSLGWETGDVVTVQLGFESGLTASLSAILHTPHFMRFHVFGSKRWVELRNDTHPDTPGGIARMEIQSSDTGPENNSFPWIDTVDRNLNAFADAIEGTAPYRFTPHEMVHNIEVLEAIAASAEHRQTVSL